MELKKLPYDLTVCKVASMDEIDTSGEFFFIGILSKISGILADAGIGIFAVSTYNTDYIVVKAENYAKAVDELASAGYSVV